MPSPAIATMRPSACRRLTTSLFCSGRTSAWTSSIPSLRATASAVVRLSPVSMTMRRPSARSASSAPGVVGLIGSATHDQARRPAVDRDEHHRLAFGAPPLGALGQRAGIDLQARQQPLIAERDLAAVDPAAHALAGDRVEPARLRELQAALLGSGDDRRRERMLARPLEAGGEPQQLVLVDARGRHQRGHLGLALGQRAGLVDHQRVDLGEALERLGVLDQHARLGAAPGADHDRHRRREAERAGAGDDQHRDRGDQRVGHGRRRAEQRPARRRPGSRPRPPPARTSSRPRRPGAGSARASAAPAATICTIRASMVSLPTRSARITKLPDWLSVPPVTWSPGFFSTGTGSPVSIDSSTVLRPSSTTPSTGIFSPGRTRRRSPTCDLLERHLLVGAVVAHAARGLRREAEQGLDRAAGALARPDLEHLAEQDQRRDHRRGLEIDVDLALGPAEGGREDPGRERRDHAVEIGRADAEPDQRPHVGAAVAERRPAALEDRPAGPEHDRRRQRELQPVRRAGAGSA